VKENIIVVLGLSPTAIYVGREAHSLNLKCFAFDFKNGAARYSKYFNKTKILSKNSLLNLLKNNYLNNTNNYYICPTSDEWISFIAKHKILFIGTNLYTSSSYLDGSYELLADKFKLMEVSLSLKLNYPKSIAYKPGINKQPNLSNLEFPVFIKPSNRSGLAQIMKGKKGWYFNSMSELNSSNLFDKLKGVELLIQEVITGPESNIKVLGTVASKGKKYRSWTGIKYRQYPHGFGSASLVIEDNSDKELESITDQLLKKIVYTGFFALETKYCEKRKKTYIIEVNTRPGLWFGATTSANCFFVLDWLKSFNKNFEESKHNKSKPLEPVVWRYLYKDAFVRLKPKSKYSSNIKLPTKKINSFAVLDKNDIKPFVFDLLNAIKKSFKR